MEDNPGGSAEIDSAEPGTPLASATGDRRAYWLVVLLFIVSGFSSLIYQVVWTRQLVFVFGSTTFASATVLAVFMGGLALGSFAAGRVSDRLGRPFLLYGILEGVIGAWALFTPHLFDAAIPLYRLIWQSFHLSVLPFSLMRFLVAAVILLPPTACMGATLPLLARFVTSSLSYVGNRVGTLYAVNTLGAVGGAGLAGFMLLPSAGLAATTEIAAALNGLLCLIVVWYARNRERPHSPAEQAELAEQRQAAAPLTNAVRLAMFCFASSGAVAMLYEVGWTRALLMVIGSTTYAFTVMLTTFLLGIFIGSLVMAKFVDRFKEPLAWFASIQMLLCLVGLISVHLFNYVPYWNVIVNAGYPNNPPAALAIRFLLSAAVLLPTTLCLGAIFPVVVKACTADLQQVGRSVGSLYSANTLGAITGAFLAGFVVVPLVGAERALIYASVANLILGVVLLFSIPVIRTPIRVLGAVACIPVMLWAVSGPAIWDPLVLLSGQKARRFASVHGLSTRDFPPFEQWREQLHERSKVVFYKDGACATVGVLFHPASGIISLLTNGHVDASDGEDMANFVLVAAYPSLVKPQAKDIALVGWGSGISLGATTLFPAREITAIEIEPAVIEASKFFHHVNQAPEKDPRVKLDLNDGRNYLLATDQYFDAIVSHPSNPWQSGVCNLFTREFFAACSQRLKKGGIFSLWLQFDEVSTANILRVLSALKSVYRYTLPIYSDNADLVILSSQEPIKISFAEAKRLLGTGPIRKKFQSADIRSVYDFLARIAASPSAVAEFAGLEEPNSDDRNRLEYDVAKTYESMRFLPENQKFLEDHCGNPWEAVDWGTMDDTARAVSMARVADSALRGGNIPLALKWADAALAVKDVPDAYRARASIQESLGNTAEALKLLHQALSLSPDDAETLLARGSLYYKQGQWAQAKADYEHALACQPGNLMASYLLAQNCLPSVRKILADSPAAGAVDDPVTAARYLSALLDKQDFIDEHHDVLKLTGMACEKLGKPASADKFLTAYLALEPNDISAWRALATILFQQGNQTRAAICWDRSFALGRQLAPDMIASARSALSKKDESGAIRWLKKALELAPGTPEAIDILAAMSKESPQARQLLLSTQTPRSAQQAVGR